MTVGLSYDERLVQDWLRQRDYETEYEPPLVTSGKRPDFLATGSSLNTAPRALWAEVKSLAPDTTTATVHKILSVVTNPSGKYVTL